MKALSNPSSDQLAAEQASCLFGCSKRTLWVGLALTLASLAVFAPGIGFDFVNYDDPDYVTANPMVQQGLTWAGIRWAFTSAAAFNWHPMTWLSHMLDCRLFGLNPAGHHATSVILHALNALLLFLLLERFTGATWRSAFVAALFSLHPLRLESVVWVCERKDVLSAFFFLLTLWSYCRFASNDAYRRTSSPFSQLSSGSYLLCLLFFSFGLMSKPMLVTLPFVLLLLDLWPLNRLRFGSAPSRPPVVPFRRLVLEKLPFFGLAFASAVVTFLVQKSQGAVSGFGFVSPMERVMNAVVSVLRYVGKLLWPVDLAVYYPMPASWPIWLVATALLFIVAGTIFALWQLRGRPWFAVGWFWFLGALVPVIGIVQVGTQSMADRYTYIPCIGLLILAAWSTATPIQSATSGKQPSSRPTSKKTPSPSVSPLRRRIAVCVGVLCVAGACASTVTQVSYWKNSRTLFEHALKSNPNNIVAQVMLANTLEAAGQYDAALDHYCAVLRLRPEFAEVRYSMANVLTKQNKLNEAVAEYKEVLRRKPDYPEAWYNLSIAQEMRGSRDESMSALAEYARLCPGDQAAQAQLQRQRKP